MGDGLRNTKDSARTLPRRGGRVRAGTEHQPPLQQVEMPVQVGRPVEGVVVAEHQPPGTGHDDGGEEQVGELLGGGRPELAPLDPVADDPAQGLHLRTDHLGAPAIGEVGEAADLREQHPDDLPGAPVLDHLRVFEGEVGAQDRHGGALRSGGEGRQVLARGTAHLVHRGKEQVLLAREVQVDRALGDAGAGRHVVELGRHEAAAGEFLERRLHDLAGPLLLAPPALSRHCHLAPLLTAWSVISTRQGSPSRSAPWPAR